MEKKNKSLFAILAVAAIVLVVGVTYAFITITLQGEKENTITGGSLTVTLDDTSDALGNGTGDIELSDQFPVSDDVGKTRTPYTFTLQNNSAKDASYTIYLDEESVGTYTVTGENGTETEVAYTRMADSQVKVYLTDGSDTVLKDATKVSDLGDKVTRTVNGSEVQSSVLYSGVLAAGGTINTFVLRLWIASDADDTVMGKAYATKVSVDAVQVPEYAVTVVNSINPVESISQAVFSTGTAKLTITKGEGTASVTCTTGTATIAENATDTTKLDVTVPNVTAHTTCTVSYS